MDNAIDRVSVCEILSDIYPTDGEKVVSVKKIDKAYEAIQQLPPAQPKRKAGKWVSKPNVYGVVYCSECDYELRINSTNYCPHCGLKMEAK